MNNISMMPDEAKERGGLIYYGETYCLSKEEARPDKGIKPVNVYGLYGYVVVRSYD